MSEAAAEEAVRQYDVAKSCCAARMGYPEDSAFNKVWLNRDFGLSP